MGLTLGDVWVPVGPENSEKTGLENMKETVTTTSPTPVIDMLQPEGLKKLLFD
jgi:hypothetical protein